MRRRLRHALLALVVPLLLATAAPGLAAASSRLPVTLTGTYERLVKDVLDGEGHLDHVYTDVLRVPGRAIPIRLPAGHGLRGGTPLRLSAQRAYGAMSYDVRSFRQIAPASVIGTTGTASVLVILAHWTKPDAVTRTRAAAQIFGDDDKWFREVSYGKAGLAGVVTPWVRIPPPVNGRCFADAEGLMASAQAKAAALGGSYSPYGYDRTILYFPRCVGGDTVNVAGWAYEPGSSVWLNGSMDRRTTVHEIGHNYGLGHAMSLSCKTAAGTRVTLGSTCSTSVYGDPYDAMGRSSSYAAHFSGYHKDVAGWLGARKRVLTTSSASFTLPPIEKTHTVPLVVVAKSPVYANRSYWLEYRRPIGMDARLPVGATGGVLVHMVDTGKPGVLLDGTPSDGSMATAVLKAGTSWTSPDKVKITVGVLYSTGAKVSVSGARPAPTPASAPRYFTAKAMDASANLTWAAPSSIGNSAITAYQITAEGQAETVTKVVGAAERAVSLAGLYNDVQYTVSIRARNAAGLGTPAYAWVTPRLMNPSVRLTDPAAGTVLTGRVELAAIATPHPVTESAITCLYFYVDGSHTGTSCGSEHGSVSMDTTQLANGAHELQVYAIDDRDRVGTDAETFTVYNPVPEVTITSPAQGATVNAETVTLEAAVTVPGDPSPVFHVTYYDVTGGWERHIAYAFSAPYTASWRVSSLSGTRQVVAVAITSDGRRGRSLPVELTITHPPSSTQLTNLAPGATVRGASVALTAEATVTAPDVTPLFVVFQDARGEITRDYSAPYQATWNTSNMTGSQYVETWVFESSGRRSAASRVAVTVANALPLVAITAPTYAQRVQPGTIRISGTATPSAGGVPPDRVVVSVSGLAPATAQVVDGAWSYDWNSGTSFGYRSVTVRSHTPEGLVSAPAYSEFFVVRTEPATHIESPVDGQVVRVGTTVEVVIAATTAANDPTTVTRACASIGYYYTACASRGADGKFRVPVPTNYNTGPRSVNAYISMSDGVQFPVREALSVFAAYPPQPPRITVTPGDGSLTIGLSQGGAEQLPVTGYVVTLQDGQRATPAGSPASVTFTGLVNGQSYTVNAAAVNDAGQSTWTQVATTPGAPPAAGATTQAAFAPLLALPATALGRRRRAAARPWRA